MELEEKNLNKEIEDIIEEIIELEQKWLREQNELVKLAKEREIKRKELQEKKQELTVLNTKKMRIESKQKGKASWLLVVHVLFISFLRAY
jgi:hypothetical protein